MNLLNKLNNKAKDLLKSRKRVIIFILILISIGFGAWQIFRRLRCKKATLLALFRKAEIFPQQARPLLIPLQTVLFRKFTLRTEIL